MIKTSTSTSTSTKPRRKNSKITLPGKQALKALQELEFMLISLKKIENHYFYEEADFPGRDSDERAREIARFISEKNFILRLATVRKIISERFDRTLGKDDMDDTERAMEHLEFWENPGD